MSERTRIVVLCLLAFAGSLAWFLTGIDRPAVPYFDELHYVPAARAWLAGQGMPIQEHPPLGPALIAASMAVLGDQPLGWRLPSAVAGAMTLACMGLWGWSLRRRSADAALAIVLAAANQLLYVQARIAMLDALMMAFLAAALVCFTHVWLGEPRRLAATYAFGALMAAATACKSFALCPWASLTLLMLLRPATRPPFKHLLPACALLPLLVYSGLFIAASRGQVVNLWHAHAAMYDAQLRVGGTHPYASHWLSWPLQLRPIWYAYAPQGKGAMAGVVLLGNPLVLWGGLLALLVCCVRLTEPVAQIAVLSFVALYLPWCVVPRQLMFAYYYYPAAMVLTMAWVVALRSSWLRWAVSMAAVAVFAYFWPLLANSTLDNAAYVARLWFASWV